MSNLSNVFAAIGALLIIVAIGGLTGLLWGVWIGLLCAMLLAGIFLLVSSYALYTQTRALADRVTVVS